MFTSTNVRLAAQEILESICTCICHLCLFFVTMSLCFQSDFSPLCVSMYLCWYVFVYVSHIIDSWRLCSVRCNL